MPYHFIRRVITACPLLLTLAACDDVAPSFADDGEEIQFRTCPPHCSSGDLGNTSYAGDWALANINTAFGVAANNWLDGDPSTATMTSADVWLGGVHYPVGLVDVTADGELRVHIQICFSASCSLYPLTGALVVGAKLNFELGDGMESDSYWVQVYDYEATTINGKPAHAYTLTTNANNATPEFPNESHPLCYANSAGETSTRSVFLPGVQLDPNALTINTTTNGAIIACETGADGKMVLGFGYHPTDLAGFNRYTGALKMTTGDICGTGHALTTPGRLISIQDSLGIHTWSGSLTVREGDYNHTGMICRGQAFRGPDGVQLDDMLLQAPCLQHMPICASTLTPPGFKMATFGVKVEGGIM